MRAFFYQKKAQKQDCGKPRTHARTVQRFVKAFSQGKVTRRELVKWGLITAGGALAPIHGLNPFVSSAYASGGGGTGSGIRPDHGRTAQPDIWRAAFQHTDAAL